MIDSPSATNALAVVSGVKEHALHLARLFVDAAQRHASGRLVTIVGQKQLPSGRGVLTR
jgi:hypothetical protein